MSSSYSSNLRVELIGSGDQAGTWGTTTDNNFAYIFDAAIAGYQAVTISSTNQALTYVNGPTSSAALNQSIYAILKFNSAAAASAVYAPPVSKQYIVWNNTSYTITIYNSTVIGNTTAAGTGIAIAAGNKIMVWSDGTNFYDVQAQNLTGTLAIVNGGTGQTTQQTAINALVGAQTNNRVLRSDGTNSTLSQVNVSTDVTGTLAVANGGTGATTSTGTGAVVLAASPTITNATLTTPTLTTPTLNFPTLNNFTLGTYGNIKTLFETATITASAPSATTNFDVTTQAVQFYTSNASTNFTLNFRGSATSTVTAGSFVVNTIYTIATIGTTDFTLIGAASNTVGVIFAATGVGAGSGTATTGTLNSILSTGQSVTCSLLVTNGGTAYYPSTIQIDGSSVTPKWQTGSAPTGGNANSVDLYTFAIVKTANLTYTVLASQVKFA
jgi:hypothetical protein